MVRKVPLLSFRGVVMRFMRPIYLVKNFQTSIKSSKLKRGNQYLAKNFLMQCPFKWYHALVNTRNSTINFKTWKVLRKSSVLWHTACSSRSFYKIITGNFFRHFFSVANVNYHKNSQFWLTRSLVFLNFRLLSFTFWMKLK